MRTLDQESMKLRLHDGRVVQISKDISLDNADGNPFLASNSARRGWRLWSVRQRLSYAPAIIANILNPPFKD